MRFVSLHHHTTFSFKDGYGTPEQHVARAAELGMGALAVTEHGNVSSHVRLEQAASTTDVKPLFGVELYTGEVEEDKRTQRKNHLTVLAETQAGYRNLLKLVSRGWAEGYYYEPTVSGRMLAELKDGLVVTSGCTGSLGATSLVGGKNVAPEDASYERSKRVHQRMQGVLGDSYYLEVQAFPELANVCTINQAYERMSNELGIPLVATLDVHYTQPDESEMQQILHNVRGGNRQTVEEMSRRWGYDVKLCPPLSDKEVYWKLRNTGLSHLGAQQAVLNTAEIAQRCNVRLPKISNLQYPLPPGYDDPVTLFRKEVADGWKYRHIGAKFEAAAYRAQVKLEMELIEEKGFVDYFLVIGDAVRYAKDRGIPVGPARGSAAASLVCYLLRITEVDPLPFPNLLFSRFIDRNRHDLPDIDLDFDDERRWEVKQYLVDKYGEDRVGQIGTFVAYKGKNSLDDVQRSLYPDRWDVKAGVERVKELLLDRSSGDLRYGSSLEDTYDQFQEVRDVFEQYPLLKKAMKLEGNFRDISIHAAGLVIANEPLTNACAVYTRVDSKKGTVRIDPDSGLPMTVVSLDKHDAEYLNVLKLDALGLKTMSMIRIALEQIGMTLEELYAIPLADPATIDGFHRGDVVGIFQFDGRAMRSVNSGVRPDNFLEVCDINALARPGPLHSGATADYIDAKHGRAEAHHWHPIVDGITQHTQFQVVYQEQILQIVREIGQFSWEEAARIRKIISKKRGEQEFNQQRDKFIEGASTVGMNAKDANAVFSMLATAGAYAFNAAHCVSYGMLAYWTMWLKQNHPQAFFSAFLRKFPDKQLETLKDCLAHGLEVLTPDPMESELTWHAAEGGVRAGFKQIRGIGDVTGQAMLDYRRGLLLGGLDEDLEWVDYMKVKGIGPKTIDTILDFVLDDDPFEITKLHRLLEGIRASIHAGFFDTTARVPRPSHTAEEVPYEKQEHNEEVTWLGVCRSKNLKDLFEAHQSKTGKELDPETVKDPTKREWVVMTCEDDTGLLTVTVDRWRYERFKKAVWTIRDDHDVILVRGWKYGVQARKAIYVSELHVINPDD